MEITRSNFERALGHVRKCIADAEFIAFDTELTGLQRNGFEYSYVDTLQQRYEKVADGANNFMVTQFGICTFRKVAQPASVEKQKFEAYPFYFHLFPNSPYPEDPAQKQEISFAPSAFQFLLEHNFDFNRWIKEGIHTISKDFEEAMLKDIDRKTKTKDLDAVNPQISHADISLLEDLKISIRGFLESKDAHFQTEVNSFHRILIQKYVQPNFPYTHFDFKEKSGSGFVLTVLRTSSRELREQLIRDLSNNLGFRKVLEMLKEKKCVLVGHNSFTDFVRTYHLYQGSLPESVVEFSRGLNELFPKIIDTKFIVYQIPNNKTIFPETGLGDLETRLKDPEFSKNVTIETKLIPEFLPDPSNPELGQHNAAYDALLTGTCYAKLMGYIAQQNGMKFSTARLDSIGGPYFNYINMMKSDIQYLVETAEEPRRENWVYITCSPDSKLPSYGELSRKLDKVYGQFYLSSINTHAAFLQFRSAEDASKLVTSVLKGELTDISFQIQPYENYLIHASRQQSRLCQKCQTGRHRRSRTPSPTSRKSGESSILASSPSSAK